MTSTYFKINTQHDNIFIALFLFQDLNHVSLQHRETACKLVCYEFSSCIYYSFDAGGACRLCIHDDISLFTSGEIQNDVDFTSNVYVKSDPSAAFRNTFCSSMHPQLTNDIRYNMTSGSIEMITMCYTNAYGSDGYSGFDVYSDGQWLGGHGSCLHNTYYRHTWHFDEDEIILRVVYYFSWVLLDIAIYTNKAGYGPLIDTSGDAFEDKGYNFLGFVGWSGALTDVIGSNFERC